MRAQDVLDRLGDLGFHLLGPDPGIGDRHGHDREGDVGHQVDAEAADRTGRPPPPGRSDDHGDEDGLLDGDIGDFHGRAIP